MRINEHIQIIRIINIAEWITILIIAVLILVSGFDSPFHTHVLSSSSWTVDKFTQSELRHKKQRNINMWQIVSEEFFLILPQFSSILTFLSVLWIKYMLQKMQKLVYYKLTSRQWNMRSTFVSYDRFFPTTTLLLLESIVTTAIDSRRLSTSRDSSFSHTCNDIALRGLYPRVFSQIHPSPLGYIPRYGFSPKSAIPLRGVYARVYGITFFPLK